ncbi:MAG: hypothetical protein ABIZ81_03550, partial [Opitutaceae bacterium]
MPRRLRRLTLKLPPLFAVLGFALATVPFASAQPAPSTLTGRVTDAERLRAGGLNAMHLTKPEPLQG